MDDSPTQNEKSLFIPYFNNQSVLPVVLLRGFLFGVSQKRIFEKDKQIFTQDGISICFTGETLNQTDLKVFESTISLYAKAKNGKGWFLTSYSSIAKEIGWARCGKNIEMIKNSIARLKNSSIRLILSKKNVHSFEFIGHLIDEFFYDELKGKLRINFNHEIFPLFSPSSFCLVDKKIIKELGKKQLASWLIRFYCTHAQPYDMSFDYLAKMAGTKVNPESKRMFKEALEELKKVCDQVGFEFSFEIEENKIKVKKQKSKSQIKFLAKGKS